MDAIVDNEPTIIPLDVGSDYDRQFVFDLMWNVESNWDAERRRQLCRRCRRSTC